MASFCAKKHFKTPGAKSFGPYDGVKKNYRKFAKKAREDPRMDVDSVIENIELTLSEITTVQGLDVLKMLVELRKNALLAEEAASLSHYYSEGEYVYFYLPEHRWCPSVGKIAEVKTGKHLYVTGVIPAFKSKKHASKHRVIYGADGREAKVISSQVVKKISEDLYDEFEKRQKQWFPDCFESLDSDDDEDAQQITIRMIKRNYSTTRETSEDSEEDEKTAQMDVDMDRVYSKSIVLSAPARRTTRAKSGVITYVAPSLAVIIEKILYEEGKKKSVIIIDD